MGSFLKRIARAGVREAQRTERKSQQREKRFVAHMSARWTDTVKRFPQHRFYVAGILPEEAVKVRVEGVRKVVAVPRTLPSLFRGWWEVVPLQELATAQNGEKALFAIRTGMELTPLKLHPNFVVEEYVAPPERKIVTPDEEGRKLIATPLEVLGEVQHARAG